MTSTGLAGVQSVTVKGRVYHYHRKSKRRLSDAPTAAEVAAVDASAFLPRTLAELMASYRAANVFLDLKPATRVSYEKIMLVLRSVEHWTLDRLTAVNVATIRDDIAKTRGRRTANVTLAVLSVICKHGIERGVLVINPTNGLRRVKRLPGTPEANRPWTPAERKAFIENAPRHVALAIGLIMFTGLRRTDACEMPRTAYANGFISLDTSKTGQHVKIPVHLTLAKLLADAPRHEAPTLIANWNGAAWTPDGLSASFQKVRRVLLKKGLVGESLTLHGLRHTVGRELRSCTDDIDLIRRWFGHKTLHMALHYSKTADMSGAFVGLMGKFDPLG